MVQPQTMGRFDTLAFAQAARMAELAGNRLSTTCKDTLALAYFRSGNIEKALELQKETNPDANPAYHGRLERYQATLALLEENKQPDKDK